MNWEKLCSFLQTISNDLSQKTEYEIFNLYSELHGIHNVSKAEIKKIMDTIRNFKKMDKDLRNLLN